jgi:GNAT superfamily N-acetyltransferase
MVSAKKSSGSQSKYQKALGLIKKGEYRSLLSSAIKSTIPRQIFYFDRLYIVGASDLRMIERRNKSVLIKKATETDEAAILSINDDKDLISKRFQNNAECFIAYLKGETAGIIWAKFSDMYLTNCGYIFSPSKKYAWIFDVYIIPKFRLSGTFNAMMEFIFDYVKERGFIGCCGEIHYTNKVSINSHIRMGFNIIEEISYINIIGFHLYLVHDHVVKKKRLAVRFVPRLIKQ